MAIEVKLPELGENVESGQVVRVLVAVGDRVEEGQAVVELETDKAAFEVPCTASGEVLEIHVKEGDEVRVGQVVLTVGEGGAASAGGEEDGAPEPEPESEAPAQEGEPEPEPEAEAEPAPEAEAEPEPEPEPEPAPEAEPEPAAEEKPSAPASPTPAAPAGQPDRLAPASPSVRRLARELGLDVNALTGSGPAGRVSLDDVKAAARSVVRGSPAPAAGTGAAAAPAELPDFTQWGEVEREPMSRVRQLTAQRMAQSWSIIPQVTQHDRADITDLEAMRRQAARRRGEGSPKLTVTAVILKAVARTLREFPVFNASLDTARSEIVLKRYVHLGVAVDTDRGLLVPVVRDADRKGVLEIAAEVDDLARRAREKKIQVHELAGASFTVTNLGGIAGTGFTPIVNHPEVAILGVARSRREACVRDEAIEPRLILPLSLTYDHRLIDGADGARFLARIVALLENPLELSL